MCISVDLPEPDGPITAVSLPRSTLERDAAQRVDGGVSFAETARQLMRLDDGAVCPVTPLHVFSVPVSLR